jgi:hypothetical protein
MSLHNTRFSSGYEMLESSGNIVMYEDTFGLSGEHIEDIVSGTLNKHLHELPSFQSPRLWKKHLREMMKKEDEKLLGFLTQTPSENSLIGPVETLLKRYTMRNIIDVSSLKSMDQVLDSVTGLSTIQSEIDDTLKQKGPSNLNEIKEQISSLIHIYQENGTLLFESENLLKQKLEKIDTIQRSISQVLYLQENSAMPSMISSIETYLTVSFEENEIEKNYKDVLFLYNKHNKLRESIATFVSLKTMTHEPLCPICIEDSVEMAITPCGHTFCGKCVKKMPYDCYMCRGKIRERLKIYFS